MLKLAVVPADLGRSLVGEMWLYPDGSRVLELSTKCGTDEGLQVAAKVRGYLEGKGANLDGVQQTKTRMALDFFSAELRARTS